MDKIEKIRAEITRLKGQLIRGACAAQIEMETNCKDEAYNEVLAFLDTLSEESDKSLEEAADNFAHCYDQGTCDGVAQECFIAGAKRKEEQLMKGAVEGEVVDSGFDDGTAILKAIVPDRRYDSGDKVKLIVIKED